MIIKNYDKTLIVSLLKATNRIRGSFKKYIYPNTLYSVIVGPCQAFPIGQEVLCLMDDESPDLLQPIFYNEGELFVDTMLIAKIRILNDAMRIIHEFVPIMALPQPTSYLN